MESKEVKKVKTRSNSKASKPDERSASTEEEMAPNVNGGEDGGSEIEMVNTPTEEDIEKNFDTLENKENSEKGRKRKASEIDENFQDLDDSFENPDENKAESKNDSSIDSSYSPKENLLNNEDDTMNEPDALNLSSEMLNIPDKLDPITQQSLGKGKRARVPNKRYSDIAPAKLNFDSPKPKPENGQIQENEIVRDEPESDSGIAPTPVKRPLYSSPIISASKKIKAAVDLSNPNFLKPFKYGWKRELVYRANSDISLKRNGDIYYYTPTGKKVRSMREVAENLINKELSIDDFTFFKEPLGLADPEKEIIRDAKFKTGAPSGIKKTSTPKLAKAPVKTAPKSPKASLISSPTTGESTKVKSPKISSGGFKVKVKGTPNKKSKKKSENNMEIGTYPPNWNSPSRKAKSPSNPSPDESISITNPEESISIACQNPDESISNTNLDEPIPIKSTNPDEPLSPLSNGDQHEDSNEDQHPSPDEESEKSIGVKLRSPSKLSKPKATNETKAETVKIDDAYLQSLAYGYKTLLYVFQYLKVQDLLRAGCVCTMWRDLARHQILWNTVRMKNSQIHSFEGLANALLKHGTVHLDLRKMLLPTSGGDDIWPSFTTAIKKVESLRKIELCRCLASVVEDLARNNHNLEAINAVTIKCESMTFEPFSNLKNLTDLRLKSTTGLSLTSDLTALKELTKLKHLSITSIKDLFKLNIDVIGELVNIEVLDLGECTDFPKHFGPDILRKLVKLEKLRLEKGQGECYTFDILEAVKDIKTLTQLELVNFDIKAGFDKALGTCVNIKKLLMIPTYISQSATTNHMVLGGVLKLQKTLSHFVWGVTLELLRVTELFVDQCEQPEKKEISKDKNITTGDSIPVLKPVPLHGMPQQEPPAVSSADTPQVEILPLPNLQKLLLQNLPTTRVKILKIPFHATWRQSITDSVN